MSYLNPDFVLEFVVNHITCRNFNAMKCPLSVKIPGCPPIELNPKQATMTKLTYEKGKRLIFKHARLLDLNVVFQLLSGHGNLSIRGKCSFDFFEICDKITENDPTVYQIDITMERSDHSRLGVLNCQFQIFPYREYEEIRGQPRVIPPLQIQPPIVGQKTPRKIVRPVQSARAGPPKKATTPYRSYNSQKSKRLDDEVQNESIRSPDAPRSKSYRPLNVQSNNAEQVA